MDQIVVELFLLSIGASFVQRTTGFGFGIFIMTMLPSIMPSFGEATTLSGILAMTTSLIIVIQKYKYITWRRLLPILFTFIIISIGAIFVLRRMEYHILNILLGITLIIVSIYFTFFSKRIKVKTTLPVQVTAGTLSGLMGGFFGMQGPPAVLYFVSSEPDKEHYLAMTQTYFLAGNLMMTLARAYNGFFTTTVSIGYVYGIAGVFIGKPDRRLGVQAPQRLPAQIHHLCLYRNQRINLPAGGVTLCQANINSRTLLKDRVINKHFMLKDKV